MEQANPNCRSSNTAILAVSPSSCTISFGDSGGVATITEDSMGSGLDVTVWIPIDLEYEVKRTTMKQITPGLYQDNEVVLYGRWISDFCL